jgi:hypothetical protein
MRQIVTPPSTGRHASAPVSLANSTSRADATSAARRSRRNPASTPSPSHDYSRIFVAPFAHYQFVIRLTQLNDANFLLPAGAHSRSLTRAPPVRTPGTSAPLTQLPGVLLPHDRPKQPKAQQPNDIRAASAPPPSTPLTPLMFTKLATSNNSISTTQSTSTAQLRPHNRNRSHTAIESPNPPTRFQNP